VGVNWIQAVEFSKWRTDRVNEAILEKNIFEKGAKTNDAEKPFSTETHLKAPTMTYGGDEEIVLKEELKSVKAGKDGKGAKKNVYAQRSSGLILPEYRLPTEAEWEHAAAADVGQRV
jgi:gliding motility-associated lipoprotein GldJ